MSVENSVETALRVFKNLSEQEVQDALSGCIELEERWKKGREAARRAQLSAIAKVRWAKQATLTRKALRKEHEAMSKAEIEEMVGEAKKKTLEMQKKRSLELELQKQKNLSSGSCAIKRGPKGPRKSEEEKNEQKKRNSENTKRRQKSQREDDKEKRIAAGSYKPRGRASGSVVEGSKKWAQLKKAGKLQEDKVIKKFAEEDTLMEMLKKRGLDSPQAQLNVVKSILAKMEARGITSFHQHQKLITKKAVLQVKKTLEDQVPKEDTSSSSSSEDTSSASSSSSSSDSS